MSLCHMHSCLCSDSVHATLMTSADIFLQVTERSCFFTQQLTSSHSIVEIEIHPSLAMAYGTAYKSFFFLVLRKKGSKGQTTLSTKSRWRFRTKRRSKVSFDHTRLRTFRFHINRPATVRQSKTRTKVEYRSRAAQLENDETTKTCLSTPPSESHIWCTLR